MENTKAITQNVLQNIKLMGEMLLTPYSDLDCFSKYFISLSSLWCITS